MKIVIFLLFVTFSCYSYNVHAKEEIKEDEDGMHNFFLKDRRDHRLQGMQGSIASYEIEKNNKYWIENALETIKLKTSQKLNTKKAKNIILFIGDGMGVSTLTAARIYEGQLHNKNGEESFLTFEKYPYSGLSKTYCVDSQVADSACTSTAYTNGVKGSISTMGLNGQVKYGDCTGSKNKSSHTESILTWAQEAKKSTGIVTTTRVTHASPGGLYSHIANRDWESDKDTNHDNVDCKDIANQLINQSPGNKINVILGGGLNKFMLDSHGGERKDECLVSKYKNIRKGSNETFSFVTNKKDLKNVSASNTDYLLGLFSPSHMSYELDKDSENQQPSLTEMTAKAIEILQKNKNGFYLFVEGGRIDMAHHDNKAKKALVETIEFANAIKAAENMTNSDETLIVVTADHSHTFTISGYPERGNPILSKVVHSGKEPLGKDQLPYLTLGYNNGYQELSRTGGRLNVDNTMASGDNFRISSGIPLNSETHGGEDVAVYAKGPWAHLLTGNYEQNYIPIVMAYASRIGPGNQVPLVSSASTASIQILYFTLFYIFYNFFN